MSTAKAQPKQVKSHVDLVTPQEPTMAVKEAKPEYDFSKMDPTELLALAAKLKEQAQAGVEKEFTNDVNYIAQRSKALGRTLVDYAEGIVKLMDDNERHAFLRQFNVRGQSSASDSGAPRPRAARGTKPPKVMKSADAEGGVPQVGKTYKLNGQIWKKEKAVGAVKKEFLDAVKHGATWAQLEVKDVAETAPN